MKKTWSLAMFSFFFCVLLGGCKEIAEPEPEVQVQPQTVMMEADTSMEKVAVLSYEIPEIHPSILVNQDGYQARREKRAVFLDHGNEDTFQVRKTSDNQVVLEGDILWQEKEGSRIGYGDFTNLLEEGEYYFFTSTFGASKDFTISGDYFEKRQETLVEAVKDKARDNEATLPEITELLVLYEWYPEIFEDADENQIPDVLEFIAGWSEREESESVETAAVLAKFSFLYRTFDMKFATKILNKASTVYRKAPDKEGMDASHFFALTELYRATGLYAYRVAIEKYQEFLEKNTDFLYREGYLYGTMTYIMTHQKVKLELGKLLLSQVNAKAEENANYFQELIQPTMAKNNGPEEIMERSRIIIAANYVMNNLEYNRIIEGAWDYLAGQNESSKSYFEERESEAGYLLLVGQLHAVEDRLLFAE